MKFSTVLLSAAVAAAELITLDWAETTQVISIPDATAGEQATSAALSAAYDAIHDHLAAQTTPAPDAEKAEEALDLTIQAPFFTMGLWIPDLSDFGIGNKNETITQWLHGIWEEKQGAPFPQRKRDFTPKGDPRDPGAGRGHGPYYPGSLLHHGSGYHRR